MSGPALSDVAAAPGRRRSSPSAEALPALLLAVFLIAPLAGRLGGESYVLSVLTRVLIMALAAMSLDVLIGAAGLVSFGHAAFVGIGVYAVGIMSAAGIDDGLAQAAVALGASSLFALLTGAIAIRTQGVYFIMITLAFGQMLYFLATALGQFGGDDGMTLQVRSQFFGRDVLGSDLSLYYGALGVLAFCYIGLRRVAGSRFGRVLAGTRENQTRMMAVGFRPFPYRLASYVTSAMIAALAGCLLANQSGFISPAAMTWQRSGELIFMVVLGGVGSLHGAILGAAVFIIAEEALASWSEHWRVVFGPLLILSVFFARNGLSGVLPGRKP